MEEVKDCPFCGGPGELHYNSGNEVWGQSWQGRCTRCAAQTGKFFGSSTWRVVRSADDKAQSEALQAWNRRILTGI